MRKTYDEYIQARIFKVYTQNKKAVLMNKACESFEQYAKGYGVNNGCFAETVDWLMRFGCGKQRAKDYAHYIQDWLKRNTVSK